MSEIHSFCAWWEERQENVRLIQCLRWCGYHTRNWWDEKDKTLSNDHNYHRLRNGKKKIKVSSSRKSHPWKQPVVQVVTKICALELQIHCNFFTLRKRQSEKQEEEEYWGKGGGVKKQNKTRLCWKFTDQLTQPRAHEQAHTHTHLPLEFGVFFHNSKPHNYFFSLCSYNDFPWTLTFKAA